MTRVTVTLNDRTAVFWVIDLTAESIIDEIERRFPDAEYAEITTAKPTLKGARKKCVRKSASTVSPHADVQPTQSQQTPTSKSSGT